MPKRSLEWAVDSAPEIPLTEDEHGLAEEGLLLLLPELVSDKAFEEWQDEGKRVVLAASEGQWSIGDWIVYGEELKELAGISRDQRFKHAIYSAAAEITGLSIHTIKDYAYVARNVPASVRTDALSFGHHRVIAGLPECQQIEWLTEMQLGKLSVGAAKRKLKHRASKEQPAATPQPDKRAEKIIQLCKPLAKALSEGNMFLDDVPPEVSCALIESLETIRKLIANELLNHKNISVDN